MGKSKSQEKLHRQQQVNAKKEERLQKKGKYYIIIYRFVYLRYKNDNKDFKKKSQREKFGRYRSSEEATFIQQLLALDLKIKVCI
jgi:hypothetical protein